MDLLAIQGLDPAAGPEAKARALEYFELLKVQENGWRLCVNTLLSDELMNDYSQFFCFQVLENFVKYHYINCDSSQQQFLRHFYSCWIQKQCASNIQLPSFLSNKVAHVLSLVFLVDYPHRWATFFDDVISTLSLGSTAVDMYLRLLKAINSEVVEREIIHSAQEAQRNTMIKDKLRDYVVVDLVSSWSLILVTYEAIRIDLTNLCLDVIGAYISWIDINLIANDMFVERLIRYIQNSEIRENACECIYEIISKKMDPTAKTRLVEFFFNKLQSSHIFDLRLDDDAIDFEMNLAKLINRIGSNLILSCLRLIKSGDNHGALLAIQAIEDKMPLLLKYLSHEDDGVSQNVIELSKEYVQLCKQCTSTVKNGNIQKILFILIKKYKYDETYKFNQEGEDEALFIYFRKSLKVLFDNIAALDRELVVNTVRDLFTSTIQSWHQANVIDVELAITFLYLLGEAIPVSQGNHFVPLGGETKATVIQEMMRLLVSSNVSCHPHPIVSFTYFETVARYEKFFIFEPNYFPAVLQTFLDSRGLKHGDRKVRSRSAYLFSRMAKSLRQNMQPFTEEILKAFEDLLILTYPGDDFSGVFLVPDDQLYLYETAAILIVSGSLDLDKKRKLIKDMLVPVINRFSIILNRLTMETDDEKQAVLAECLIHAMAVTSRTSKAFSNQQTMKANGCVQTYIEVLHVFLSALQQPHQLPVLQSGFRQFLHRMVVCLEEEVLAYFPMAAESLLKNSDFRSIQEFIPLVNQVITKFKKEVVPFLQQVFKPLVTAIVCALDAPMDERDQQAARDKQTLQRHYFLFIATIVTNGVTDVLSLQDSQDVQQVLQSVIRGAVAFPDPSAQKTCFIILKKLVELWGGANGVDGFDDFIINYILPACFDAPLMKSFDLNDAQTILVLNEISSCLKTMYNLKGDKILQYLQERELNKLNLQTQIKEEYFQALRSDLKIFKNYQKTLYRRLKS